MVKPFFLSTPRGRRLALHHPGTRPDHPLGLVVHVHPFAEEMNKARRMAALQARALAAEGFAVLQIDLMGCGDSEGALADTRWDDWLDDVAHATTWLRQQHPGTASETPPLWLWGLRAGALLAAAAARERAAQIGPCHLLLWQPVVKGQAHLQQFLRLITAGALDGAQRRTQAELRAQLQSGQCLEVAGYRLPPALALGLEAASLLPTAAQGTRHLLWLETSTREEPALLPASLPVIEDWKAQGWQVQALAVRGPAFWQTTEIEDAPALLQATNRAVLAT
jgi:exosortase A-associated hydrolase 2